MMARYQEDHRETLQFLAASLDRLLPEDSVARAIRAGLDPLDFSAYDALYANDAVGRPAVDCSRLRPAWVRQWNTLLRHERRHRAQTSSS